MVIKEFVDEFLAHSEWWFANDSSIDLMLCRKYYGSNDCEKFLEVCEILNESCDVDTIIYLDQLGRHLMRLGVISKVAFDAVYVTVLSRALMVPIESIQCVNRRIFILLAIRHSRNVDIIMTRVLPFIGNCNVMRRFKKATLEVIGELRMPGVVIPRHGYYLNGVNFLSTTFAPTKEECDKFIFDEPLDLPKVSIKGVQLPNENYIISLSGGVDSTVLTLLAKDDERFKGCIHINYTNRDTSDAEEEYVRRICNDISVKLYVRRIDEVNRVHGEGANDDRTFYEEYTRKVRFNSYAYALRGLDATCVLLGHNACDVEENIITNTIDGTMYENLKGMTYESYENNIKIIRPFINTPKSTLVTLANTQRIPYVWNSTPAWSRRGQIRSKINTIDQSLIAGMMRLSDEMSELYKFLHTILETIEYKRITDTELRLVGNFPNIESAWKIIFQKVCGMMNIPYVSKKSIANFQRNYDNKSVKQYIISKHLIATQSHADQTSLIFIVKKD